MDDNMTTTTGGGLASNAADDPRETAPMSPFSARAAGIGFVVLLIGLVVVFGIPVVLG
ncbi:DUF7550 family protein [Halococcus salsus]|uniref:DUF7550 family protein n=1 Tax=Halococcus salsus TaxID=2162894 RepID=UPI00186581FA|nr:hypothetical protein [Halococcus salsus]